MKTLMRILVTAIIPLAALGFSGVAIYLDDIHFKESLQQAQQLAIPHAQHEEIYNKLTRLDAVIVRAEDSIKYRAEQGEDTSGLHDVLLEAYDLRNESDRAWNNREYDRADALVDEAYVCLNVIPPAPILPPPAVVIPPAPAPVAPVPAWSLYLLFVGVALGAIVVGIIVWFIAFHERREHL